MILFITFFTINCLAAQGQWQSKVTGRNINFVVTDAKSPKKDFAGKVYTIVYLEGLNIKKAGRNSNEKDVNWLLNQGFRVVELRYAGDIHTVSPAINADIIAINDSIAAGRFCDLTDCSHYRSYVLLEGYRIALDEPYFKDDPTVYNTPKEYKIGYDLKMDIIYPANSSKAVPVILSFSYSNSYATYDDSKKMLTDKNRDQRLKLEYTLAAFNDSFLEGAPAMGMAWAIADHPKYCPWGEGTPVGGQADTYKSYQANPDAARKVRSALRTLRKIGKQLGLSGKIGIYGFSRGSSAGSMAIGDKEVPNIDGAGFNVGISHRVQAAALGPGVFDYTQIYNTLHDGDENLETRCVWAWGTLNENYAKWKSMGSIDLVRSSATAPVLFFYNTDDDHYYGDQITHFKAKLDSLHIPASTLMNYGKGHAVPQDGASLKQLYQFFMKYLKPPFLSKEVNHLHSN